MSYYARVEDSAYTHNTVLCEYITAFTQGIIFESPDVGKASIFPEICIVNGKLTISEMKTKASI